MSEALIIKDGKFYRGDVYVKPEHGNNEQIECLKEYAKQGDIYKEGLIVHPEYDEPDDIDTRAKFDCICGNDVRIFTTTAREGDIGCYIGKTVKCIVCGAVYIFAEDDDGELIVKFK